MFSGWIDEQLLDFRFFSSTPTNSIARTGSTKSRSLSGGYHHDTGDHRHPIGKNESLTRLVGYQLIEREPCTFEPIDQVKWTVSV